MRIIYVVRPQVTILVCTVLVQHEGSISFTPDAILKGIENINKAEEELLLVIKIFL
jgi:hypothetical protein